jgi:hypothetical protein
MALQVYASKAEIVGIMHFRRGEMLQFPTMRDLFEILHREWPVIKAAPYSFFISLTVIAGIIWAVFEFRYRKRLESRSGIEDTSASSSLSDSGNSTATGGNASAKIGDIHLYAGSPVTTPVATPKESDDPAVISFEDSQNTSIVNSGWVFVEHAGGIPILVAVFRNKIRGVGITTPIAYRVTAHLTFKSKQKTVSVDHGAWLGEYTYFTDFRPNDQRKLVVVFKNENSALCTMRNFCSFDPRQRRMRSGITTIHHPAHIPLGDQEWEVEIVLVANDTALFSRKFWLRALPDGGWTLI